MTNNMYIDFHAHILPAADHGSQSVEQSVKLLNAAYDAGVRTVVATPHFYPARREPVADFIARRDAAYDKLEDALRRDERLCEMKLLRGAEVMISLSLHEIDGLSRLCAENTNVILIERNPAHTVSNEELNAFMQVADLGLEPIIAHIDRYDEKSQQALLRSGFYAQLNASAFAKFLKKGKYVEMTRLGYVKAIGSDVHHRAESYHEFEKAMKMLGKTANELTLRTKEILGL